MYLPGVYHPILYEFLFTSWDSIIRNKKYYWCSELIIPSSIKSHKRLSTEGTKLQRGVIGLVDCWYCGRAIHVWFWQIFLFFNDDDDEDFFHVTKYEYTFFINIAYEFWSKEFWIGSSSKVPLIKLMENVVFCSC